MSESTAFGRFLEMKISRAGTLLRLLVLLLGLSWIICSSYAVPVSRTGSLAQDARAHQVEGDYILRPLRGGNSVRESIGGRMGIEVNDYPGSGANNRHMPKPQTGRGCTEC